MWTGSNILEMPSHIHANSLEKPGAHSLKVNPGLNFQREGLGLIPGQGTHWVVG